LTLNPKRSKDIEAKATQDTKTVYWVHYEERGHYSVLSAAVTPRGIC